MDIAIIGHGIVGSGVAELIRKNHESIRIKAGEPIRVKKILDIVKHPDSPDAELMTDNPEEIFGDIDIKIIIETIGGTRAALEYTKRALQSGRHVVTSNKELVATYGPELMKLAAEKKVRYLFEGSVGGGIPIIRPLNQCLAANEITAVTGILNGTTNYILTQMRKEGRDFHSALKSAQEKGYAEANPAADIEGHDSCRKIAILSSIAYNEFIDHKHIYTEGISKIAAADINFANAMGAAIKLVAMSRRTERGIFARVSPLILPLDHPLAGVEDVFNAIVVSGNAIGDAMFYGRGAGKLPTASAVTADVIDIARHAEENSCHVWERKPYDNLAPFEESITAYYLRISVRNPEEATKVVNRIFGKVRNISTEAEQIVFVTEKATEKELSGKVEELKGLGSVRNVESIIRYEAQDN